MDSITNEHQDQDQDQDRRPACYRCHASKLRCTRPFGQKACRRCMRAKAVCEARPSRRGVQQTTTASRTTSNTEPLSSARPTRPPSTDNISIPAAFDFDVLHQTDSHSWNMDIDSALRTSYTMSDTLSDYDLWSGVSVPPPSLDDQFVLGGPLGSQEFCYDLDSPSVMSTPSTKFSRHKEPEGHGYSRRKTPDVEIGTDAADSESSLFYSQELTRVSLLLLNHQKALSNATKQPPTPPTSTPETRASQSRASFKIEDTLQAGLEFLRLLNSKRTKHHLQVTGLLLLSCYTRLASIFRATFLHLESLFGLDDFVPFMTQVSIPSVRVGSLCLDHVSPRLQVNAVLDTSERLLEEISDQMKSTVASDLGAVTDEGANGTACLEEVAIAVLDTVTTESASNAECIAKLRRSWNTIRS